MALFDQLAKLKQRSKKSSKSQSSNLQNSSPGGTTGNCGFCVSTPNVSTVTITQANTLRRPNVNKSQDWLNVDKEKSVRFTLPPDEVKRRSKKANANRVVTFIPQTEQVSTIDSDWPSEAWHSTGLNTGSGSGSGFSNFQSRTNGGASLGSFGNNQDPFQSHLLSVGNSAEQQSRHQHCTTDYNGGYEPAGLAAFNKGQSVGLRQRCCWSSRSCRRFQPQPLPPPPPPRPTSSCCCCNTTKGQSSDPRSNNDEDQQAFFYHRNKKRPSKAAMTTSSAGSATALHSVVDIVPDYTDDEEVQNSTQQAFLQSSYYPSGSMTLPHTKSSHKVQASSGTSQPQPLKKATSTNLEKPVPLASAIKATSAVALAFSEDKNALEEPSGPVKSSPTPHTPPPLPAVKKSLNESGESDPGYESDSTGSKSKTNVTSPSLEKEGPKATTLPRRSAAVQKISLDRRKLPDLESDEGRKKAIKTTLGLNSSTVEIISPVRLEHRDVAASQTLRAALSKVEAAHPGFSYDLVLGLVRKADASSVNMNESLLRLQGAVSDQDCIEYRSSRTEEPFQELNKKSVALKRILARIPEEISDRKTFLETIKEIASAIKKLLDAVNEVSAYIPGTSGKQALDQKKREFVKYSKRFSNTLKEFFRDGQPGPVFTSATYLIYQTNQVMITVKDKCE